MHKSRLTLLLLFICATAYGQRQGSIDMPEQAIQELVEQYPDQDFILLESKHRFRFERGETGEPVVRERVEDRYLSLVPDLVLSDVIFFDNETRIDFVKGFDHKGKSRKVMTAESAYQMDGVFHSDAKICEIFYEGLGKGERMGILHEKTVTDVKYLTTVFFQAEFPIFKKQIEFEVPDWMEVELAEMNFEGYALKKREERVKGGTLYTYSIEDVPMRERRMYLPGPTHSLPHILVLSKSFQDRSGKKNRLLSNTEDLYAWYRKLVQSVPNQNDIIESILQDLVGEEMTKREKAETLFYWVQENIRYIAFHEGIAGFKPATAQSVCSDRYGDCKGMANLLKQMLSLQGMDARLSWLGTRHIAYDYSLPSLAVDNHMICTLFLEGDTIFLDPTEKSVAFGNCAHRIQGRPVMIEDGETFLLSRIPEQAAESNESKYEIALRLDGTKIAGEADFRYKGESRLWINDSYSYIQQNHREDALKSYVTIDEKNMIVRDIKASNLLEPLAPLQIDFDFELNNQVVEVGDELYVGLDLYQDFAALEIDSDRVEDLVLPYKMAEVYDVSLVIPAGYEISYMPKNYAVEHEDFKIELDFRKSATEDKIIYSKRIVMKEGAIRRDNFEEWNRSVKALQDRYEDRVILRRQ